MLGDINDRMQFGVGGGLRGRVIVSDGNVLVWGAGPELHLVWIRAIGKAREFVNDFDDRLPRYIYLGKHLGLQLRLSGWLGSDGEDMVAGHTVSLNVWFASGHF